MIANLTQKFTTDIFRGTFSDIFREATFEKDCDGLSVCLSVCLKLDAFSFLTGKIRKQCSLIVQCNCGRNNATIKPSLFVEIRSKAVYVENYLLLTGKQKSSLPSFFYAY